MVEFVRCSVAGPTTVPLDALTSPLPSGAFPELVSLLNLFKSARNSVAGYETLWGPEFRTRPPSGFRD